MPKQKDLKKIVRTRMEKTGESYTAARLHVVRKKETPQDFAKLAGMRDDAVKKQTGRNWSAWVKTLDAVDAAEKPHREIAAYVSSLGTPDWWTQMVTVGYERIRGLRDKGQRRGGAYEASKSRTFAVPIDKLYAAFANARTRARWLTGELTMRTSKANRTMRAAMPDGTLVQFYFVPKGDAKSTVTIQHQKLPDKAAVAKTKALWAERLDALSEILA